MKINIFATSDDKTFSVSEDGILSRVRKYLNAEEACHSIQNKIDRHGAITFWGEDCPERWCRIYPLDHPELLAIQNCGVKNA